MHMVRQGLDRRYAIPPSVDALRLLAFAVAVSALLYLAVIDARMAGRPDVVLKHDKGSVEMKQPAAVPSPTPTVRLPEPVPGG